MECLYEACVWALWSADPISFAMRVAFWDFQHLRISALTETAYRMVGDVVWWDYIGLVKPGVIYVAITYLDDILMNPCIPSLLLVLPVHCLMLIYWLIFKVLRYELAIGDWPLNFDFWVVFIILIWLMACSTLFVLPLISERSAYPSSRDGPKNTVVASCSWVTRGSSEYPVDRPPDGKRNWSEGTSRSKFCP